MIVELSVSSTLDVYTAHGEIEKARRNVNRALKSQIGSLDKSPPIRYFDTGPFKISVLRKDKKYPRHILDGDPEYTKRIRPIIGGYSIGTEKNPAQ